MIYEKTMYMEKWLMIFTTNSDMTRVILEPVLLDHETIKKLTYRLSLVSWIIKIEILNFMNVFLLPQHKSKKDAVWLTHFWSKDKKIYKNQQIIEIYL